MTYEIRIDERALKSSARIPSKDLRAIFRAIDRLSSDPRPPGVRGLLAADISNIYRLAVRDYRVIYQVLDKRVLIYVIRIGNRKDVYKGIAKAVKQRALDPR
jgi:mRNA interferase RelE/StbE